MRHSIKRIVLIEAWAEGYITLLYKTNDILDPSNYRGLIIKSSIGKLFNRVLNAWLDKFLIKYNVIDECQIGFRKKARTSDHMFVLKTIIDKYCEAGNKKLYYIWCGFHTISLAKSVTWYTEYLMYFFHCEETRRLVSIFKKYWSYVSIFKYIDRQYSGYVTKFRSGYCPFRTAFTIF